MSRRKAPAPVELPPPRPTCKWCGKPLAKYSRTIFFKPVGFKYGLSDAIVADVRSKAEAQKHTNLAVISVQRGPGGLVSSAGVWDRESWGLWGDGLFCTGSCAQAYGGNAARAARGAGKAGK